MVSFRGQFKLQATPTLISIKVNAVSPPEMSFQGPPQQELQGICVLILNGMPVGLKKFEAFLSPLPWHFGIRYQDVCFQVHAFVVS